MKTTDLLILGVAGIAIYYLFFKKGGIFDIGGGSVGGSGSTSGDTTEQKPFLPEFMQPEQAGKGVYPGWLQITALPYHMRPEQAGKGVYPGWYQPSVAGTAPVKPKFMQPSQKGKGIYPAWYQPKIAPKKGKGIYPAWYQPGK